MKKILCEGILKSFCVIDDDIKTPQQKTKCFDAIKAFFVTKVNKIGIIDNAVCLNVLLDTLQDAFKKMNFSDLTINLFGRFATSTFCSCAARIIN